jgi:hypothetical protein
VVETPEREQIIARVAALDIGKAEVVMIAAACVGLGGERVRRGDRRRLHERDRVDRDPLPPDGAVQ